MRAMNCSEFLDQIDRWMEGERSPAAEAHLSTCPQCRNLIADLDAIRDTASTMAASDPEPPARVWIALRAQLEQEGLIREPRQGLAHWLNGLLGTVPRPALAGAYLAALVAVGFAISGPAHMQSDSNAWMSGMQSSTQPLSASLDTAEQDTISSLADRNPVVTASLRKNLAIIDNNIALCEKSVREQPDSEFARDYLYEAYQQKADLIAQVTEGGDDGR
jgi:hypothetical protein